MSKDKQRTPDVEIEITNGKTVKVDLSPIEWIIILAGLTALASAGSWIAGVI
jgi:hypothetical protein